MSPTCAGEGTTFRPCSSRQALIPVPRSALMEDVSSQVADNAQVSLAPEITVTRRTTVSARANPSPALPANRWWPRQASVAGWNNAVNADFQAIKLCCTCRFQRGQRLQAVRSVSAGFPASHCDQSENEAPAKRLSRRHQRSPAHALNRLRRAAQNCWCRSWQGRSCQV